MHASVLDPRPRREVVFVIVAVLLSIGAHGAVATGVSKIEVQREPTPRWVEVEVYQSPPKPEPEPPKPEPEPPKPEPKPEPEVVKKPPPKPEVVQFEDTTPEPEPEPRPKPRRIERPIQGLSAGSFAEGPGDFQARAGTTTSVAATDEIVSPDEVEEFAIVPYTSVNTAPRIRGRPTLTVPDEVIAAQIQGRVEVELTIGADGSVTEARVVAALHPAADAACVRDLRQTRWRAGQRDGTPVIVTGVPYSCRYEQAVR